ncbi:MAG: hypothetical protein WC525_10400 [Candidatus Thermoplasmatota archaeon]
MFNNNNPTFNLHNKVDNRVNSFPEITLTHEVYSKLCAYADLCNYEISALGSVRIENNQILVDDVFLFSQVVSGSSVELSQQDVSQFMVDCIKKGKDPSSLKFWWHSHVNMDTFWSATDTGTIDRFSSDWMISMVSNKRKDHKVRLDVFAPFRMYMDDLPLNVEYDMSFNVGIRKEIDQKVRHSYIPDFFAPRSPAYPSYGAPYGSRQCEVVVAPNEADPFDTADYQVPSSIKVGDAKDARKQAQPVKKEPGFLDWVYNFLFVPPRNAKKAPAKNTPKKIPLKEGDSVPEQGTIEPSLPQKTAPPDKIPDKIIEQTSTPDPELVKQVD